MPKLKLTFKTKDNVIINELLEFSWENIHDEEELSMSEVEFGYSQGKKRAIERDWTLIKVTELKRR